MLEIPIPPQEIWDPVKENFIKYDGGVIKMEHSLRAIQKWEAKYKKPFKLSSKFLELFINLIASS
jgi:hypothetical protein